MEHEITIVNPVCNAEIGGKEIYTSYMKSPYLSLKHSSYFQVYNDLLGKYRGKELVFVEIGVKNGGSLFMWRDYFGPGARIIGIDFNPEAKQWESEGFEIHIGSQSDPDFWKSFFNSVGMVDIVVDDGGHTYEQQIVTADCCIPFIRNGGMLIVEDTHTSYFRDFGYPTKYSFVEWAKKHVDSINSRFPGIQVPQLAHREAIYTVSFYESMVSFAIERTRCFQSESTSNEGISFDAVDYRYKGSLVGDAYRYLTAASSRFRFLKTFLGGGMKTSVKAIDAKIKLRKVWKYF